MPSQMLPLELVLLIVRFTVLSEYPRKQVWVAQELSCVNHIVQATVMATMYPRLVLNALNLPKLQLAVTRGIDSPITRYTTELHLPLDVRLRPRDTNSWRTFIFVHVPRLEAISALGQLLILPLEAAINQADIRTHLFPRVRRVRIRVPFGVEAHGILGPTFVNLTHLHIAAAWDASSGSVGSLSGCTTLTHVLVDRMPHEAYYRSRPAAIVGIVLACLRVPALERILVRYQADLTNMQLVGMLRKIVRANIPEETRIWLDDETYPPGATDAIEVHLCDSLDGEAAFLRGRQLHAGQ